MDFPCERVIALPQEERRTASAASLPLALSLSLLASRAACAPLIHACRSYFLKNKDLWLHYQDRLLYASDSGAIHDALHDIFKFSQVFQRTRRRQALASLDTRCQRACTRRPAFPRYLCTTAAAAVLLFLFSFICLIFKLEMLFIELLAEKFFRYFFTDLMLLLGWVSLSLSLCCAQLSRHSNSICVRRNASKYVAFAAVEDS